MLPYNPGGHKYKIKISASFAPSRDPRGKFLSFPFFQLLELHSLHSLALGLFLPLQSQQLSILFQSSYCCLPLLSLDFPLPPFYKDIVMTFRATQITQNNLCISGTLIWSHLQSPYCHVGYHSQIPGIRMWYLWGHYSTDECMFCLLPSFCCRWEGVVILESAHRTD